MLLPDAKGTLWPNVPQASRLATVIYIAMVTL